MMLWMRRAPNKISGPFHPGGGKFIRSAPVRVLGVVRWFLPPERIRLAWISHGGLAMHAHLIAEEGFMNKAEIKAPVANDVDEKLAAQLVNSRPSSKARTLNHRPRAGAAREEIPRRI